MTMKVNIPDTMSIALVVQNTTQDEQVPADRLFQQWAESVPGQGEQTVELTIRLVDEEEGRKLNSDYRNKDCATNVLSFPADLPADIQSQLENQTGRRQLGDLVLCAPLVNREAEQQGKPAQGHWAHLVIHGILHLRGYDHQSEEEALIMEQIETETLAALGIANPYEPRVRLLATDQCSDSGTQ